MELRAFLLIATNLLLHALHHIPSQAAASQSYDDYEHPLSLNDDFFDKVPRDLNENSRSKIHHNHRSNRIAQFELAPESIPRASARVAEIDDLSEDVEKEASVEADEPRGGSRPHNQPPAPNAAAAVEEPRKAVHYPSAFHRGQQNRHFLDRDRHHRLHNAGQQQQQQQQQQHHSSYGHSMVARSDRFWHNNRLHHTDWCTRDCEQASHVNRTICASDGRLYKSMCELKRHSCRHNVRLQRKPKKFCPNDVAATNATAAAAAATAANDQVRIVELKKLCDASEYSKMKHLLFNQFNGNIKSMFRYFDTNADNYIEAHELWPEQNSASSKLIYAQVWDNHTTKCPQNNIDLDDDQSKCWYFLDFVFQPQFPKNPCSLSHLMLFDLRHPNHRFDIENFERAFSDVGINNGSSIINSHSEPKVIKKTSEVNIGLGDSVSLRCVGPEQESAIISSEVKNVIDEDNFAADDDDDDDLRGGHSKCMWTRYNSNLAASKEPHISIREQREKERTFRDTILHITEAQLYLSGQFKCVCHFQRLALNYEHSYQLNVLAAPRVTILPKYQWSLPNSRVSFECHYDQISTRSVAQNNEQQNDERHGNNPPRSGESTSQARIQGQFGLQVKWMKEKQQLSVGANATPARARRSYSSADNLFETPMESEATASFGDNFADTSINNSDVCNTSSRASISIAASRLTLENLEPCDSGRFTCQVELPHIANRLAPVAAPIVGQDKGILLVQDKPKDGASVPAENSETSLWIFHENGLSIYKIQNDDGQEMELLHEINGHSLISADVDGNWNQLTLCGGLNPEQAVICEWSDNAVFIDVDHRESEGQRRKYVYVGQPNLNRVIVFDSFEFEIVAVINTEPQPRKLHLYEPNRIHLSKWVKRRLSPAANARWESAIGTRAHPLESTPQESRLYSSKFSFVGGPAIETNSNVNESVHGTRAKRTVSDGAPMLKQHDIWLLCYGQPLVLNPAESGDDSSEQSADSSPSASLNQSKQWFPESIKPFQPRLSGVGMTPFAWLSNIWIPNNKEARLRNRKSVHIIQSTFFPNHNHPNDGSVHQHPDPQARVRPNQLPPKATVVTKFPFGPPASSPLQRVSYLAAGRHRYDLIQDLFVPAKPYSMEKNSEFKIHHAYVTHYDERRLFRISMDDYRYDRDIDLQDCDPIHSITAAQGLIIVQCRAPISHSLIGQLVLDQLTTSRIEFNANLRAQESYLSPDNHYLVSIFHNFTSTERAASISEANNGKGRGTEDMHNQQTNLSEQRRESSQTQRHSSIVYVQTITTDGLRLQYEIKTLFEISQCSFVWKDGYYAAIFVTTNRRDQQSEILSLRLIDSRLELMARVPGLVGSARHKEQLTISPELRLAALTTNQGTYVVDLEENRVSQSLRRHQSPPTLLWV